jgi:hypothetical protein
MYNHCDVKGDELDDKYLIEPLRRGFDLIIVSRGGSTGRPCRKTPTIPKL